MRIGAKLLLTYLILLGVVTLAAGLGLPRLVENAVEKAEQSMLERQARTVAERLSTTLNPRADGPDGAPGGPGLGAGVGAMDRMTLDETVALVNPQGVVVSSNRPGWKGAKVPDLTAPKSPPDARPARRTVSLQGEEVIWATAPITNLPPLKGYEVLVVRDLPFIQSISKPITNGLLVIVIIGFIAALLIAGWVSREMVKRLNATGEAARALAEGDLAVRAPEKGTDEITELATHFNHMAERIEVLVAGLRRSETARNELLMMVGHDLRTPMTSITGFAEALRDGVVQDEERKQRFYEIIATESQRLTRLTNDLFDVAKLESGQMELRLQAISIAPLLREFADSLRELAQQQSTRLDLAITPEAESARVYGDRDRLEQVLGNLASNALRFTKEGEAVTIRATVDGTELVVAVEDKGPGLTPDEAAQVFQRFFQGAQQGRGHKGAGLGLAIVKSLIEAHGGKVGVASVPGQGATFWFRLNIVA
ncbi:MAG: sensor histidine kinase [Mycobacterium leprae]